VAHGIASTIVYVHAPGQPPNPELTEAVRLVKKDHPNINYGVAMNRRITELYAKLYNRSPDWAKWSGMAALASNVVGVGMIASQQVNPHGLAEALFKGIAAKRNAPGFSFQSMFNFLGTGNWLVYEDLYHQLMAYRDGGIDRIVQLAMNGMIDGDQRDGFIQIDQGRLAGAQGLTEIWDGNQALLQFEQEETLQNVVYDLDRQFWTAFSSIFGTIMASPIPGHNQAFTGFVQPHLPAGTMPDLGEFGHRWDWIADETTPVAQRNGQFQFFRAWAANNNNIDVQRLLTIGYL